MPTSKHTSYRRSLTLRCLNPHGDCFRYQPGGGGGFHINGPIDYETKYAASITACAPLEDEDRANAHLTQEIIAHDQRTARLNIFLLRKKDLMENLHTDQRHVKKNKKKRLRKKNP